MGRIMGRTSDWPSNARRKRAGLKWRPPPEPGRSSHVRERSGLAARAESLPRFPGAPGGLRGRGRGVRQVRAGLHHPGRPPEQRPLRTRVRGPAELLRRCGRWALPFPRVVPGLRPAPPDRQPPLRLGKSSISRASGRRGGDVAGRATLRYPRTCWAPDLPGTPFRRGKGVRTSPKNLQRNVAVSHESNLVPYSFCLGLIHQVLYVS